MIDAKTRFQKVMLVDDNAIDLYITTKIIKKKQICRNNKSFYFSIKCIRVFNRE